MTTSAPKPTKIHIAKVIQNARVFKFKDGFQNTVNTNALLQNVAQLFALLRQREIDYLLVGGIALLQYVDGRNTEDIDLIMALSSLKTVSEIELISEDRNFARGKFGALQIDVLLTRNPLFETVQKQYATSHHFVEQDIPCATVEGLLLLKLYALPSLYRQGDFVRVGIYENDIATLMYRYQPDIDHLLAELAPHLSQADNFALREVVADLEQRIARFGKGFQPPSPD